MPLLAMLERFCKANWFMESAVIAVRFVPEWASFSYEVV
jgi:hypothetical protein